MRDSGKSPTVMFICGFVLVFLLGMVLRLIFDLAGTDRVFADLDWLNIILTNFFAAIGGGIAASYAAKKQRDK